MGGCLFIEPIHLIDETICGRSSKSIELLKNFQLNNTELTTMFKIFKQIHPNSHGQILISDVINFFDMPHCKLSHLLIDWGCFDDKYLSFVGFVTVFWFYLSYDICDIGKLLYCVYDEDNAHELSSKQVADIVKSINIDKSSGQIDVVIAKLLRDYTSFYTYEDFSKWIKQHSSITNILLAEQMSVRRKFINDSFWRKQVKHRIENMTDSCSREFYLHI